MVFLSMPRLALRAETLDDAGAEAVAKKLKELNDKILAEGEKGTALNPTELETVVALCGQLEASQKLPDSPAVQSGIPLIFSIATTWPTANRLPGLDLLRLLAAATPVTATAEYDGVDLITGIMASGVFDTPFNVNNAMLSIRTFANLFETDPGRNLAMQTFDQLVTGVKSALANSGAAPNRNLTIAVTTLYINFAVYLTSEGRAQTPEAAERGLVLLEELIKIVSREKDSEAVYRGLVALGTLIRVLGAEVKSAAKEIYEVKNVLTRVSASGAGKEPRVMGVISEINATL